MILVLSGAFQGERGFVEARFPEMSFLKKDVSEYTSEFLYRWQAGQSFTFYRSSFQQNDENPLDAERAVKFASIIRGYLDSGRTLRLNELADIYGFSDRYHFTLFCQKISGMTLNRFKDVLDFDPTLRSDAEDK